MNSQCIAVYVITVFVITVVLPGSLYVFHSDGRSRFLQLDPAGLRSNRGGVHSAQSRVLLQAVWPVLHQRGDGQDRPLPQHRALQEPAGTPGPGHRTPCRPVEQM